MNLTRGMTLVVIRINSNSNITGSKPCKHCCNIIKAIGIKKVIYSDNDGIFVDEKASDMCSDHISLSRRMGINPKMNL